MYYQLTYLCKSLFEISPKRSIMKFTTVVTPGRLQKMSKTCNSPGEFSHIFSKMYQKIAKCNSPGVTTVFNISPVN